MRLPQRSLTPSAAAGPAISRSAHELRSRVAVEAGPATSRSAQAFRSPVAARLVVLAGAAALVAGCFSLKPAPDTSRHFVLSATEASTVTAPVRLGADIHFGLGPITLPSYLAVQKLVRRSGANAIEYVPGAFWAETVEESFRRSLLHRTGARLGTAHAVAYPWYSTTRVDWKVPVSVLRFEPTTDGRAVLVARWSVEDTGSGRTVATAESSFEEVAGADAAEMVDALSRCVDRLAETIAAAVAKAAAK